MSLLEILSTRRESGARSPGRVLGSKDREEEQLRRRWSQEHPDGGTRCEAMLRRLESVRANPGESLAGADLRGANLADADLSGLDLSGADLTGADLSRANLEGANLFRARLSRATLDEARLDRAELTAADLRGASLRCVAAHGAGLGSAKLEGASLAQADLSNATLTEANLSGSDLKVARLQGCRARNVDLTNCDLAHAVLRDADLNGCDVAGARLDGADLRNASLAHIRGYTRARWIAADVRDVDFNGAHLCRRFILDQNYLEEFKNQGRLSRAVYTVWWLTSDCGRSLLRWGVLTTVIAVFFAFLYTLVAVDYGDHRTPLSPLYYSVVTLTTLGYGDVVPGSTAAQVIAMTEVVLGYVMLGGLLSIFSSKMARRAE